MEHKMPRPAHKWSARRIVKLNNQNLYGHSLGKGG